jgi:outer membrane protein OmpA-like peptidoglycan-associated protein
MFRKMLMIVPIATLAIGGSTACATKKFVRTSVGEVNDKVDSLGRSVEETQQRTRANEGRIGEVDQKAAAAGQAAQAANQAATAAQGAADRAGQQAATANTAASTAQARADAVDKASKRLVFEVVLSEDQGNFKFGKKDLPDEAKARLDAMITDIKADPKGAYFEIEGYTDSIGPAELNERLGLERAEAVKRYLYEQHQIPLHKMNVISYGETKPIGENKTKAGRAQNRRVVIKVLV